MSLNADKRPALLLSLVPVVFLMGLLIFNIILFKDDATGGPNQLALLASGALAAVIGIFVLKRPYDEIENRIVKSISMAIQATLILLVVGCLIGTWILSGVVPSMIYYGLQLIHPAVILPVSALVCAIVALATGSSWSTTGTVGIALIGIGQAMGIPLGMVAGAIVSGAYFGDKMSPLSDTTNLAPAMAGTDLFTHIRYMVYTTVPAFIMALILFSILGYFQGSSAESAGNIPEVLTQIKAIFHIGPHLFIVPAMILVMVVMKTPALPAMILGTIVGGVFALIFQQDLIAQMMGTDFTLVGGYKVLMGAAYNGFSFESGNKLMDGLFNRGGMSGMFGTVTLILMAMIFGGAMEGTGMLQRIADSILGMVRGVGSLIGATLASSIFLNMTASDQYLAILIPGRMFKGAYDKYGLHPKNLSRALEDAGTVTSPLIPWNSCGAYEAGVMGVATLEYAPYAFFNYLSPVVSAFLAGFDIGIERASVKVAPGEDEAEGAELA
tara:strand:- start:48681 stop:50171 length:1491 start_codon:yes stop_codon:yes gene_type:complete